MPMIEMYMRPTCGFCHAASRLLDSKGAAYVAINITAHPEKRAEMIQRSNGGSTVPQVFIDGTHVGGYDDLNALNSGGKLDALLGA